MGEPTIRSLDPQLQEQNVKRNYSPARLYELALLYDGSCIASNGALVAYSGEKTGRCPKDKRVVRGEESEGNVWWGEASPNMPLSASSYMQNRCLAMDHLQKAPRLYIQDGFVNWGTQARHKIRVVCTRPYHALFMQNMMMRPTDEELETFGEPEFTIYNAGACPADPSVDGVDSTSSVCINLERNEMVILGTEYAGEMKKGIFSVMHYLLPKQNILTLHSGCNVGQGGDVSLFFGLSGTGKTTLSADDHRPLIGDDEHGWGSEGVFNIEGGCYAKCIGLSQEKEPHIWDAIKFGAVLENVVLDDHRNVDYENVSITENTRASYPIENVQNARIPCTGPHPKNIIMLCCDAFGVLPPVSKLTTEQAMYHFISGYTAKVAGTEMGVKEPTATFSACFGGAFLMWHPMKYAAMLAENMRQHNADAWLVNTGWVGGAYGTGSRISLKHTRAIIDAIHSGELSAAATTPLFLFGLSVPTHVTGVPDAILQPRTAWADRSAYDAQLQQLASMYRDNMRAYEGATGHVPASVQHAIMCAGPQLSAPSDGGPASEDAADASKGAEAAPAQAGGNGTAGGPYEREASISRSTSRCGGIALDSLTHVNSSPQIF